ncbi:MAG: adenylate/guanylate cyclase domain-containing protein [Alphaproteobacteria bacterium]
MTPTVRGVRLASGLVLVAFIFTHFVNHALGLVSLSAMETGRLVFLAIWRNPVTVVLLPLSFMAHLALAYYAIYRRRQLRMPAPEAVQLLMGLAIPPAVLIHILGTVVVAQVFDVDDRYTLVLLTLWVDDGGLRQTVASLVVWIHGCIGLHLWLRLKPWYRQWLPVLYAVALLLPVTGLLGFVAGGREVAALADQAGWREAFETSVNALSDAEHRTVLMVERTVLGGLAALLALTLLARLGRQILERRRGIVEITYPGGRRISIARGPTILEASRLNGIPHASVCGGRGRCSTCRVRVNEGIEHLPEPSPQEQKVLARIGAAPNVRLACQTRPSEKVSVTPLLPPQATPRQGFGKAASLEGQEQDIAIMFADIRGFTTLSEKKLPYDVVFILNRYFRSMGEAVERSGGRVDKFIGDGIMALFGIDERAERGCAKAMRAARHMAAGLEELNESLSADLPEPLRIGIGIHAGPAIVGEMGYASATSVTAIGDAVNTASRLEAMTKEFGAQLVLSQRVADLARVDLSQWPSEAREVRGRKEALTIRIVADARELPEPPETPRRRPAARAEVAARP